MRSFQGSRVGEERVMLVTYFGAQLIAQLLISYLYNYHHTSCKLKCRRRSLCFGNNSGKMAAMKSMIMGVVDVGSSMSHPIDGNSKETKISVVSSFYSSFVLQRMMASKTVEFGMVTYGSDETNNYLNSTQGGYEFVQEVVPMEKPDVNTIKYISNVQCGKNQGDLIDGIVVGQDILNRTNVKKAYNRIMVVFTDGETAVEGVEDLETIVGNMKSIVNFSLYIAMIGKVTNSSTVIKRENEKLLRSLAESINGKFEVMEDSRDGFYMLAEGAGLGTKPQMLKTTFQLSPEVRIPCVYWSKVSKAKVPTMKKVAVTAIEASEDDVAGQVKRDTTYRNPEDPDVELGPEEKVKGYKYGPQYVPVAAAEEDMFKLKSPASVTLIGAVSASSIPRHHYLEGPLFLQGAVESDAAQVSIVVLSRTLKEANKVLLARFVKRENADPFLAVLMPSDREDQDNCLLVHRLPCSEDMRDYLFPSLIAFEGELSSEKQKQQQAVSSFVDALTLQQPVPRTALCPVNPVLYNLYRTVRDKINGVIMGPVNASSFIVDTISSPCLGTAQVASALQTLQTEFPLQKMESKKKRKTYWSEIEVKTGDQQGVIVPESLAKQSRTDGSQSSYAEAETDVESVFGSSMEDIPAFTVGSVAPVEDFQAVLVFAADPILQATKDQRTAIVKTAIQTLMDATERHITLGASTAYYKRAIGCLQALRDAAVERDEFSSFNTFMRDRIKLPHQTGRHNALWRMIVESKLSLISSRENTNCSVSPTEADAFLSAQVEEAVAAAPVQVTEEEEDLFGSMA